MRISLGGFDRAQPDQGADIVGVELQRPAEAGLGLVEPSLELEDLAQPMMGLGGPGEWRPVGALRPCLLQSPRSMAAWARSLYCWAASCLLGGWEGHAAFPGAHHANCIRHWPQAGSITGT